MAGLKFSCQTTEFVTGTSKKTVLQLEAPANQRVVVKELSVSFKGTVNTDAPAFVEVARQTGAGLSGDSLTPRKLDEDIAETIQTTVLENIDGTTQPTDDAVLLSEEVHLQGGFAWRARFGDEIIIPGGGRLGIAVTSPVSYNMQARVIAEE